MSGFFQAVQGVIFLTGTVGIKVAIAKMLGIADDVSQGKLIVIQASSSLFTWYMSLANSTRDLACTFIINFHCMFGHHYDISDLNWPFGNFELISFWLWK